MILSFGLFGRVVRLDLVPHSVLVVLVENSLYRDEDRGSMHADIGVWWLEEHDLGHPLHAVEPVRLSDRDSESFGFEDHLVYPVRPPSGRAPPGQVRRYHYLCYGWRQDVYLPHSVVHRFSMEESNDGGRVSWTLSVDGTSWILHGFDPTDDPFESLAVHGVMGS